MKKYQEKYEAIIDLHQKGYCEDFQLLGDDLFWVQEKQIVPTGDFSITEHHRFFGNNSKENNLIIFGIITTCSGIKGILIFQCIDNRFKTAPIIYKKVKEIFAGYEEEIFSNALLIRN